MAASRLFNYFLTAWTMDSITEAQLDAAVQKGYITADEKQSIIATPKL